jgi:hypothetical protein
MGERMIQLQERSFYIDSVSKLLAFKALLPLRGKPWRMVDMNLLRNARNLEESLRAWQWNPTVDGEGNIVDLQFVGREDADEEVILRSLATFVKPGSFIKLLVGRDRVITYSFDGGRCVTKYEQT